MADVWIPGGYGFPPTHVGGRAPMDDAVTIEVDGWEASSRAVIPRDGTWVSELEDWSGWVGGWSIETATEQSPTGDGVLAGSGTHGARTITLTGMVLADYRHASTTVVHEAGDQIAAILSGETRKAPLRVTEHMLGLTRECDVRLAQAPDYTMHSPNAATWTLYLVADDPLRYGTETQRLTLGKATTVTNGGRVLSRPLIDIHGPITNPTITAGGNALTAVVTVAAGEKVTLDTRRRVLLNSSGRKMWDAVTGYWHHLRPGDTSVTLSGSGTGYAVVRRASAWM